jgi:hypothetical protein
MNHQTAHNQPAYTSALRRGVQRYGFQRQEIDKEFWDGAISFKYRISDSRLGKFFALDPLIKKFPYQTGYAFSENRLIDGYEFEGLEFKKFKEDDLIRSMVDRVFFPENMDQGQTPTCGPAAIGYMLAKHDPGGYLNVVFDLYYTGKASHNGFQIEPDAHLFEMSTDNKNFPYQTRWDKGMYVSDWIFNSSLRDSENSMWDYDGETEDFSGWGATNPSTMKTWMSDLIGLKNVTDHGTSLLIGGSSKATSTLQSIQARYDQGSMEALFINSGMLNSKPGASSISANHWVVYAGELSITEEEDGSKTFSFQVFSWGDIMTVHLNEEQFNDNFYGSISGETETKD